MVKRVTKSISNLSKNDRSISDLPDINNHAFQGPRRRNFRLGLKIRTKLLLLILSLLAIPYMGYDSVRRMEKFLLEGQMEALKLTSEGIATLLKDRANLFSDAEGIPEFLIPTQQLPQQLIEAIPFEAPINEWFSTKNITP